MPDPALIATPASWSAVIINWNGAADLPACVAALADQRWPAAEIVVVDNASADDSLAVARAQSGVRVLASQTNLGFAGGANAGIRATTGTLVATFNPDVILDPSWSMVLREAFATDATLGAAGGKLLFPDGRTIQHAGGRIEQPSLIGSNIGRRELDQGQYETDTTVDFLTGAALMLRRVALKQVGLFDESFYPAYYEDVDLCARLRAAGWAVCYLAGATGIHHESASVDARGAAYFQMIHGGRLRFAAKHLPLPDLVGRFLPAEVARLTTELRHLAGPVAADQAGLTVWPAALLVETEAPIEAGEPSADVTGCGASEQPLAPRDPGHPPAAASIPLAPPVDPRPLLDQLAEVGRHWLVEERPFTSSAPLLAPVIVWLRTLLNDAGPRWHVRQILAQQVEFNAAVYRALAGATGEAQAATLGLQATAAILADRVESLTTQQADLSARLLRLEQRLAALADQARTAEPRSPTQPTQGDDP